ncbi:CHAT domain-containing protein [Acaryochloris marina NIES-2412]|uniref:CHAT domain-containing protein n=1 Tax=Acaryochloris marina TaxID=155978 RepID=UPI00405A1F40
MAIKSFVFFYKLLSFSQNFFIASILILSVPNETIATTSRTESISTISFNKSSLLKESTQISTKQNIAQLQTAVQARAEQFLNQGSQLYFEKKFDAAVASWQQALNLYRQIRDAKGEGLSLARIGLAYQDLEQYRKAIQHFDIALPILQRSREQIVQASILGNLGNSHLKLGNFSKSIDFYQQSIALWKELGDPANEGQARRGLGNIYITLGKYSDALDQHRQALRLTLAINAPEALANTYNSLGLIHSSKGKDQEAHQFFQKGLASTQNIQDDLHSQLLQAQILNNLGYLELAKGDQASALASYQKALTLAKTTKNKTLEASALLGVGSVYTSRDEHSKALTVLQRSLFLAESIDDSSLKAKILHLLGATHWQLGRFQEAESYFNSAVTLLDGSRENLDDIDKVSIFETQVHSYALLRRILAEQGKFSEALEASERGRSRAFIELLSKRQASNNPSSLSKQTLLPNLQELRQVAKQQNATLVEYAYVADEKFIARGKLYGKFIKIYIWVVQPSGQINFKEVQLTSVQTQLLKQAGNWANDWSDLPEQEQALKQQFQKLHRDLYEILITPIQDLLPKDPNSPVIFIPYRELFQVSYPALQAPDGTYLIQKHTILTTPSIQALALTQKTHQESTVLPQTKSLIIGNPTMPAIHENALPLKPLPQSEVEAQTIGRLLNSPALIGQLATETSVKQKISSANIIHFATHGLLGEFSKSGVPGAIALAPDNTNDGLLTSDEILDLNLKADLVVVSACDTGRGHLTGDGVVGLSRAIMATGVPSVMITLWEIDDTSTAILIENFYKQYLQTQNKAQALRQAMLNTMKQYPHPVYWAPFTLVGQAQ